jgi:hypothetical protein
VIAASEVGGYRGTITGGVTLAQPGATADGDRAMAFSGAAGTVITIPNGAYANLGAGGFAVEFWFRTPTLSPVAGGAIVKVGDDEIFSVWIGPNVFSAFVKKPGGGSLQTDIWGTAYADGAWHHYVFLLTRDGANVGTGYLYKDGVLAGTSTTTQPAGALVPTGGETTLMNAQYGGGYVYGAQGSLDEFAIYHTALTPAQIADHYALRLTRTAFIALADAKDHLRLPLTDTDQDAVVTAAMTDAEAIILDYLNLTPGMRETTAAWDAATIPLPAKRAMLLELGELWRFRGDDAPDQPPRWPQTDLLPAIIGLLRRLQPLVVA